MNRGGRIDLSRRYHTPVRTDELADSHKQTPAELARERQIAETLEIEGRALSRSLAHRGFDEALDISAQIEHPSDTGVPIVLVSYTVPRGLIAVIDSVGVSYSEPIVPMTLAVGWRIAVNDYRVPNIVHTGGTEDYKFTSFGDIMNPMSIRELWVQADQTVAIQVRAFNTFNDHLIMVGRLSGRLFKPANPNVISPGGSL